MSMPNYHVCVFEGQHKSNGEFYYDRDMYSLSDRLKWARERKGLSQITLGSRAGVSQSTIGNLEAGTRQSARKLPQIAEVLGVRAIWLAEGTGEPFAGEQPVERMSDDETWQATSIQIPRFNTGGAMGNGVDLRDQPGMIETLRVNNEWLAKNLKTYTSVENLAVVTGFGDSMKPMFNPGDPLIVDTGIRVVEYDAIYFFRVANEGFIKRLQRIPTEDGLMIRAKSENPSYDPWDITKKMDFEVFGRVLKVWRSEDF